MTRYSVELRTRKYVKGDVFLSFARNLCNKYEKSFLNTAAKTGLDAAKTASKEVVHKFEKTGELTGDKIAEKIVKSKHVRCGFEICWRNSYFTSEKATNIK